MDILLVIFCCLIFIAIAFRFKTPFVPKQKRQRQSQTVKRSQPLVPPYLERDTTLATKPTSSSLQVQEKPKDNSDRTVAPKQPSFFRKNQTRKVTARHQKYIRESQLVLRQLRSGATELPKAIAILRRMNPYAFEELLLTCFGEQNWQIQRNLRYSADGGLDGRVTIAGKLYVIQAKRYSGYIKAEHIREFQEVVRTEGAAGGFFIHSGKTGEKSKELFRDSQTYLLSGEKLVNFVLGQKLRVVGITIPICSNINI